MDIDFKKLAPWNWFKKEQEEQQSTASLPGRGAPLPDKQNLWEQVIV